MSHQRSDAREHLGGTCTSNNAPFPQTHADHEAASYLKKQRMLLLFEQGVADRRGQLHSMSRGAVSGLSLLKKQQKNTNKAANDPQPVSNNEKHMSTMQSTPLLTVMADEKETENSEAKVPTTKLPECVSRALFTHRRTSSDPSVPRHRSPLQHLADPAKNHHHHHHHHLFHSGHPHGHSPYSKELNNMRTRVPILP